MTVEEAIEILKSPYGGEDDLERFRAAALKLLKSGDAGIREWNRLRKEAPRRAIENNVNRRNPPKDYPGRYLLVPEMGGAHLDNADLQGANLRNANLERAFLRDANLQEAYLGYANLQKADLMDANLQEAFLAGANLRAAKLCDANLQEANLILANLREADLREANLRAAKLCDAHLQEANLILANLQEADLAGANLNGADLRDVQLPSCPRPPIFDRFLEFRDDMSKLFSCGPIALGVRFLWMRSVEQAARKVAPWLHSLFICICPAFRFDGTRTRDIVLPLSPADPWTVLRRSYTGPMLAFHLLFLVLFLVPLAGRALFWSVAQKGVDRVHAIGQEWKASEAEWKETLKERLTIEPSDLPVTIPPDCVDQTLDRWNAAKDQRIDEFAPEGAIATVEIRTEKRSILSLVTRWHDGWIPLLVFLSAAIYNYIRWTLTTTVGVLRDREEQTGFSPGTDEYEPLVRSHLLANALLTVAIVSFSIDLARLLFTVVDVPV